MRAHAFALSSVVSVAVGSAFVGVARGDDDALVRQRLASGGEASPTGDASAEAGTLGCGVPIPTTYQSAAFATNAAIEIALAQHFRAVEEKMKETEGANTTVV